MNTGRGPSAFTLVELIVAMVVFVLMAVLIFGVTSAANQTTRASTRAIDATSQARVALDKIGSDFANLPRRGDMVFATDNQSANRLLFLSLTQSASESGWAAGDNRGISAVAYQLAATSDNQGRLCLLRGAQAFRWSDTGFMGLGADGYPFAIPTVQQPNVSHFDVLSPGIIAMAVAYQLYPDNAPVVLADATAIANCQGQLVYSPPLRADVGSSNKFVDLTRISSIMVGIAALDLTTLKLLNVTQVQALAAAFTQPTGVDMPPSHFWTPLATNPSSLPGSVPLPARQSMRIFQRSYTIAPFNRR